MESLSSRIVERVHYGKIKTYPFGEKGLSKMAQDKTMDKVGVVVNIAVYSVMGILVITGVYSLSMVGGIIACTIVSKGASILASV